MGRRHWTDGSGGRLRPLPQQLPLWQLQFRGGCGSVPNSALGTQRSPSQVGSGEGSGPRTPDSEAPTVVWAALG